MSSIFQISSKKYDIITGNSSRFLVKRQVLSSYEPMSDIIDGIYRKIDWVDTDIREGEAVAGSHWGAFAKTDISGLSQTTARITVKAAMTSSIGQWNFLVAAESTDNETGNIKVHRSSNTTAVVTNSNDSYSANINMNQALDIEYNGTSFKVNNTTVTLPTPATTVNQNMFCIGGADTVLLRSDGYKRIWPGLIGRVTIGTATETLGDFIPVIQLTDNTVGFYDQVSKTFYGSYTSIPFKVGEL